MPAAKPTTTFTWAIANLERETDDGYVFTAHYTVNANDGTYSSGAYGSVGFQRPDDLIPFADLTEAEVIGWVKEALGGDEKVTEIQAALQGQIDEQRAPSKAATECPGNGGQVKDCTGAD
jgi:hypothetical protein